MWAGEVEYKAAEGFGIFFDRTTVVNSNKARRLLGWTPKHVGLLAEVRAVVAVLHGRVAARSHSLHAAVGVVWVLPSATMQLDLYAAAMAANQKIAAAVKAASGAGAGAGAGSS